MFRGTTHDTRALGGRTVDGAVGTVGGTLVQGEGTRAMIGPGRWLGGPEKAGSDGDALWVIVLLLDILRLQQSASRFSGVATLSKKTQSQHAIKSVVLLHSLLECVVWIELFLQLKARLREFDCGTNSCQSIDVLFKFLSETGKGLVFLLFGDKQFAESRDDLDKRALIIMDPTAKLIERGQDPEDVELA